MSKTQVREAVAYFLDPNQSGISYLGSVYQALPKVANEQDLYNLQPAGTGVGAVVYCFIEDQEERRIADAGPNGQKMRVYTLGLLCILKSDLETSQEGQVAFDTFIDSLTARIQSDRTAGTGASSTGPYAGTGYVFQWGEGDSKGAPDLRFAYPVPKTLKGGVTLFQAIGRVTVLQVLDT